jgi:hypothetical protein
MRSPPTYEPRNGSCDKKALRRLGLPMTWLDAGKPRRTHLCLPRPLGPPTAQSRCHSVIAVARFSAWPIPHNPAKQRENPAAAGSGERFRWGKWRCCQTTAKPSLFPLPHIRVRQRKGRAFRRERWCGSTCTCRGSERSAPLESGCRPRYGLRRISITFTFVATAEPPACAVGMAPGNSQHGCSTSDLSYDHHRRLRGP